MKGHTVFLNIKEKMDKLFPDGVELRDMTDGNFELTPVGNDQYGEFYKTNEEKFDELWWGLYKYGFRPSYPKDMKWNGGPTWWCFLVGDFPEDKTRLELIGDSVLLVNMEGVY